MVANFILAPDIEVKLSENEAHISAENVNVVMKISCEKKCSIRIVDKPYSRKYGVYETSKCISIETAAKKLEVRIKIEAR